MTLDIEKSEKLPPEHRYFNISTIWIFYFRWILRLLYRLRIPHELVTLLSIASGLLAAYLFYHGLLIPGAIAIHLKDVFDACDGALARLTGRGHLAGRYLDSVGDFIVLTLTMAAIAARAVSQGRDIYIFWGALAIVSTFIQCSFFNFYQLAYLERLGIDRLSSRRDEVRRQDLEGAESGRLWKLFMVLFRFLYVVIYGWQDRLVAYVDRWLFMRCKGISELAWYGDKALMIWQSVLCFGTQIFVIIMASVAGRPEYALIFISVVMNFYLLLILFLRQRRFEAAAKIRVDGRNS